MDSFVWLLILGCAVLLFSLLSVNLSVPESCTEEARLCPDSSSVTRNRFLNCSFSPCPHMNLIKYCTTDILSVEESGTKIKTSPLGGGFTVYEPGNVTQCPVSSDNVTSECTKYESLNWTSTINCTFVTSELVYECPTNYYEFKNYKWITCKPPVPANFTNYCLPDYLLWIKTNCEIDMINT